MKQKLTELKEEIEKLILLSIIDKTIGTQISLNNTIKQLDLIDINRTVYPTRVENTLFSNAHETLTKRENILGHKKENNKLTHLKEL